MIRIYPWLRSIMRGYTDKIIEFCIVIIVVDWFMGIRETIAQDPVQVASFLLHQNNCNSVKAEV